MTWLYTLMIECSSDDAVRSSATLVTDGVGQLDGGGHSTDPADLAALVLAAGADARARCATPKPADAQRSRVDRRRLPRSASRLVS